MYIAVAIDDEKKALDRLERVIMNEPRIDLAAKFSNSADALRFIQEIKVDLAFLDIDMPGQNGLILAEKLKKARPRLEIIFVTAYDHFALPAFRLHAAGYLLKPVTQEELREQIDVLDARLGTGVIRAEPSVPLRICCFGPFRCFPEGYENRPIPWRTVKSEELLAFLLSNVGVPVHKELIVDALWPDAEPDKAANRFRVTCTYVRNTLAASGFSDLLLRELDSYHLDLSRINCDLIELSRLQEAILVSRDVAVLERAAWLCASPYMENKTYEWADKMRRRFELAFKTICSRLVQIHLNTGQPALAAAVLEAMLTRDPCDEKILDHLIDLRLQAGENEMAHKAYLAFEKSLAADLGLRPSERIRRKMGISASP